MKLSRNDQGNPGRRVEDWFKGKRCPVDDCFHIVKVAPGVYELVAGPTTRVGIAVVGKKPETYHSVSRQGHGSHPQKFPS